LQSLRPVCRVAELGSLGDDAASDTMSRPRLYRIAAWHSFIAPLGAVAFFVLWNHGGMLDWISPELVGPLLSFVFGSALLLALVIVFASREIAPRPVKEIAWLGAVVSTLLLGMLILFLSYSRYSHPTISLERMSGEPVFWRVGCPVAPLIAQLSRSAHTNRLLFLRLHIHTP
jgi:hypothetical protein